MFNVKILITFKLTMYMHPCCIVFLLAVLVILLLCRCQNDGENMCVNNCNYVVTTEPASAMSIQSDTSIFSNGY